MMYDVIVAGRGLTGAAAAKYISCREKNVALIGPSEEAVTRDQVVFSSHYDQSRIQRLIGKDAVWTLLNKLSADSYEKLEEESGIAFHSKEGCLYVNPYGEDAYLKNVPAQASAFHLSYKMFTGGSELQKAFPDFRFPENSCAMYEKAPSGHINPRLLVQAQLTVFRNHGGKIIDDIVTKVKPAAGYFTVATRTGKTFTAKKILLAPGAFINFFNFMLPRPRLRLKSESTLLARVSEDTARRLSMLPALLYETEEPRVQNIYLVRPLLYPDGNYYIKMGANLPEEDRCFTTLQEIQQWFRQEEVSEIKKTLSASLKKLMPGTDIPDCYHNKCIVSFTGHGKPYIGALGKDQVFLCGGNGYSAMCSDALGQIAAHLLLEDKFLPGFSAGDFLPVFESF